MRTFCGYRTKLLPQARAERFARCLSANPAFTGVAVKVCPTAKSEYRRHYVVSAPADPQRREGFRQAEETARARRAEAQAGGYHFWADPDSTGLYWCLNLKSHEVYEATLGSCTCPDHTFRGSRHGVPCKHMQMLVRFLEAEEEAIRADWQAAEDEAHQVHVRELADAEQARRERTRTRMAEDFPLFD